MEKLEKNDFEHDTLIGTRNIQTDVLVCNVEERRADRLSFNYSPNCQQKWQSAKANYKTDLAKNIPFVWRVRKALSKFSNLHFVTDRFINYPEWVALYKLPPNTVLPAKGNKKTHLFCRTRFVYNFSRITALQYFS